MKYLNSMRIEKAESWLEMALNCNKNNVDSLRALESDIKDEYEKYEQIITNRDSKPENSELIDHKDLLIHYYEYPPASLNQLLSSRRNEHELLDCPFCGYPREPDTLDHFIPKGDWPEFSINPNNLVPQCRGCAPTKSTKFYCDEEEAAIFLHPIYSDVLSKFRFKIIIVFSKSTKKTDFELKLLKPKSIKSGTTKIVVRHFRQLNLKERIQLYCYREVKKWKSLLKARKFDIEEVLKHLLNVKPEEDLGKDWKTALYIGILENKEFINYLGSLPSRNVDLSNEEPEVEIEL